MLPKSKPCVAIALLINMVSAAISLADSDHIQIEKKIIKYIGSKEFGTFRADQRCHAGNKYLIYLIDNFDQDFNIVPEVRTSHGEMVERLLRSGRNDIDVKVLDTALGKGLALVINDLIDGACVDAVISSIPGSNYSYDQISSFFPDRVRITSENILYYRSALRKLLRNIAFDGFPSDKWLENVHANSNKLRNDARKFAFIEALGQFSVPVILPYGNLDTTTRGQTRSVNLLSLSSNAHVFSALDQKGKRVPGYPYSPLGSGDEQAFYDVIECPHPEDPLRASLDINDDGHFEYTFVRSGNIPYQDDHGKLSFAPPVLSRDAFKNLMARLRNDTHCRLDEEIVLTAGQYRQVASACSFSVDTTKLKSYVWLNSPKHGRFFSFEAHCRERGEIIGTSVIPPNKIKELLPPQKTISR